MQRTIRQHYVPRFLLRNFSVQPGGEQVGMYSIDDQRYVPATNLFNLAQEREFYGEQELEKLLGEIEADIAPLIHRIVTLARMPDDYSRANMRSLLVFALLQASRTRAAADATNGQLDKFAKSFLGEVPDLSDAVMRTSLQMRDAPKFRLVQVAKMYPIVLDLACKLLVNRTDHPFILSDHPTALYNQYLEPRPTVGSNVGLAVTGLQMFLPLSPKLTLLCYDPARYTVGSRNRNVMEVGLTRRADVVELNKLQMANAGKRVFFGDGMTAADLNGYARKVSRVRSQERVVVKELPIRDDLGDTGRTVLMTHENDIRLRLRLSCVTIPDHIAKRPLPVGHAPARNPSLRDRVSAQAVGDYLGRCTVDEFWKFLRQHNPDLPPRSELD